jgi:hypothetical protein
MILFYPPTQQAWSLRSWVNAWRVPYEARMSVVGYASEGSACLRAGTDFGVQAWGAPQNFHIITNKDCGG